MRKLTIIGIVLIMICGSIHAQNTKNYTPVNLYMLNPLLVNPAYAGARESTSLTMMYGTNWPESVGAVFGNGFVAGRMMSVTGDVPISEKNSVGGMITENSFGVNNNLAFYGHYSYRIITGVGKLSFGLRAGLNIYSRNLLQANFRDPNDPVQINEKNVFPNFGAGVYWYSDNYFAGFSVPDFFFPSTGSGGFDVSPTNYNYTLMGGYLFEASDDVKIKPSVLLNYSLKAPLAYQVNLSVVMFQDKVWLGAGYKSKGIVTLAEFQVSKPWRLGFSLEWPTGGVGSYVGTSFEVLIRRDFSYELRTVSPAYFF